MEKSSAVLEKAMCAWSSRSTQQHSSFILFSHTLVAAVLRPPTSWLASGLNAREGPAEEYRAAFPPSGSKTTTMMTTVKPMITQLQNREDQAMRPRQPGQSLLREPLVSPGKFLPRPRKIRADSEDHRGKRGCCGQRCSPDQDPPFLLRASGFFSVKPKEFCQSAALTGLLFGV